MKLKSIRESYSRFLKVLSDAGMKINESQKADLDTFILALESSMSKQKVAAVNATKKVVKRKMNKEFQEVFESFLKHIQQNQVLSTKIENKITQINESKKIANKVNDYLNLYVESILPAKKIINYDKLKKLETLVESLKDILVINEDTIVSKKKELSKKFVSEKQKMETVLAKMKVKLNESMEKSLKLSQKLNKFKSLQLLENKTKDLPIFEAKQVKNRLMECSPEEIEENFDFILEEIKEEMKETTGNDDMTLEDEVNEILKTGEMPKEPKDSDEDSDEDPDEDPNEDSDEDPNSTSKDESENIDESYDVIDKNLMKLWINKSIQIS